MHILSKLFGSETKVKVVKLFVFNPNSTFDLGHIVAKTKETPNAVKKQIPTLLKMGLIKKRNFIASHKSIMGEPQSIIPCYSQIEQSKLC